MAERLKITVLEGDQTGQELLEQALRVLEPDVIGLEISLERFDLSLERRRASDNEVVRAAAASMRRSGLGVKAATITPEGAGDVGSPNRILREAVGGKVIVRTGRRLPRSMAGAARELASQPRSAHARDFRRGNGAGSAPIVPRVALLHATPNSFISGLAKASTKNFSGVNTCANHRPGVDLFELQPVLEDHEDAEEGGYPEANDSPWDSQHLEQPVGPGQQHHQGTEEHITLVVSGMLSP